MRQKEEEEECIKKFETFRSFLIKKIGMPF